MGSLLELEKMKISIDIALKTMLDRKVAQSVHLSMAAHEMLQEIQEIALRGGKRIRPALVIQGYKGCGGTDEKAILKASLALEILHIAFIIQDDIMDKGDTRHGGMSLHKLYEQHGERDAEQYGRSTADCGVDMLFALAFEVLHDSPFPLELRMRAIQKLCAIMFSTAAGQLMDIELGQQPLETVQETDVTDVHLLKTAKYSMEGPLHIGAILAGASDEMLFRLSEYAIPLGQAFQIRDDILGLFGSESELGKSAYSDVKEGKVTLLILKAIAQTSGSDRAHIHSMIGNENCTHEDFLRLQHIVRSCGALSYSENLAKELVARARAKLIKCPIESEQKQFLDGIAEYMVQRSY